ncbi:UNVERIFIED_CONTAM: hypothetical protein K2H54_044288 [Gekko kuhli]
MGFGVAGRPVGEWCQEAGQQVWLASPRATQGGHPAAPWASADAVSAPVSASASAAAWSLGCSCRLGSRLPWGGGTVRSGGACTSPIAGVGIHPSAWRAVSVGQRNRGCGAACPPSSRSASACLVACHSRRGDGAAGPAGSPGQSFPQVWGVVGEERLPLAMPGEKCCNVQQLELTIEAMTE